MTPERGSVLLLFPAAVLVMLVMAAITVDAAVSFLGQRELANAVSAAANDAATLALDLDGHYASGVTALDSSRVASEAEARVRAGLDADRYHAVVVEVRALAPAAPGCPPTVEVAARAEVDHIFAGVIPGAPSRAVVAARARSQPQEAATGC